MKPFVSMLAFSVATVTATQAQEAVRPLVAPEFGKQVTVRAEFVSKPDTYYAQNFVSEPYALKVVEVDGRVLKQPVQIEYRLVADKSQRSKFERPNQILTFEAYESLYQPATATPWLADGEQGVAYVLVHVLYIRLPKKS